MSIADGSIHRIRANNTVLATGGTKNFIIIIKTIFFFYLNNKNCFYFFKVMVELIRVVLVPILAQEMEEVP